MSRRCKRRRICEEPTCARFGPMNGDGTPSPIIHMALDEYETIRLIDLQKLTQEQCAQQMNVARTTVQSIYAVAREKLAQCLVNGTELIIEGGDYELCNGEGCCRPCWRRCNGDVYAKTEFDMEENEMRVAVTYENGEIFPHFGHTEQFKIYGIDDGKVTFSTVIDTNGSGHGALAGLLKSIHVDALICGGIGGGAQRALSDAGIALYGGVSGKADNAVEALLAGTLAYSSAANCEHHGEHHSGECGEQGCGEHSCERHNCE